jgi:hypothetical protein
MRQAGSQVHCSSGLTHTAFGKCDRDLLHAFTLRIFANLITNPPSASSLLRYIRDNEEQG